jgi:predicted aspartyl protease
VVGKLSGAALIMNLSRSLAALPLWVSGLLLVGLTTVLVVLGPVLVHRFVRAERLAASHAVAGHKFATLGVLYAVTLAFAVIVVWERFRDAKSAVMQEAGAVIVLHRLAGGLDADRATELRARVAQYVRAVIDDDWPAMARGAQGYESGRALTGLYAAVLAYEPEGQRGAALLTEMLNQLGRVAEIRRLRFDLAAGTVPGVVWFVLLTGAVVTIIFTFFFGMEDLAAQVLMTAMLALMMVMGLFVVIEIEHPFTGPVRVTPEALVLALESFADAH